MKSKRANYPKWVKYNEALSSGDKDGINKARSDFSAMSDEVLLLFIYFQNSL